MDLAKLGQIAGLAGIAVGAVVLIFRSLIEKGLPNMPARERGRTVITIAALAFGIGVVGIGAWTFAGTQSGTSVVTRGDQSPGVVSGGNADIRMGQSSAPAAGTPQRNAATPCIPPAPANARVETGGAQSPGVIAGCDTNLQIDGAPRSPNTQPPLR